MPRPKGGIAPSDSFYTSTDVRERLGISGTTLTNLVDKGVITKVVPPGYKNGYYTKESVDEYQAQQNLFLTMFENKKKGEKLVVRKAIEADQQAIFEMEAKLLGGPHNVVPVERRIEWQKKNPDIDYIVTDGGEIVGHLALMPVCKDSLQPMLEGKIRGWQLTPDDVEVYETSKQYTIFIMNFNVRQDIDKHLSSIYAALLLRQAQVRSFELAEEGKIIKVVYATSVTKGGIFLANRMEFKTLLEHSNARRKVFELDMATSKSEWAREYREHLEYLKLPKAWTKEIIN